MGMRESGSALRWAGWGILVLAAFACEGTQREFSGGPLATDSGAEGEPTTQVLPLGGPSGAVAASQLATLGSACSDAAGCASGYCVDGLCCDGACTELCATCAAPGSEGVCSPAASDPACDAISCPGSTECRGRDQTGLALNCEAVGKCRAALTCAPLDQPQGTSCQNGLGLCDGLGACVVVGKATLGAACGADGDCAEGHCVTGPGGAGICCDAPCDGVCEQCSVEGRCDTFSTSDARCAAVACPADNACRDYPATLTANLCRGLGQCKSAQDCPGAALRPAASCDCDATGACALRRGVRCTADAECGAAAACVANIAGETICCAQACGEGLICASDGSGCVECEGTEVSCEAQTAIHCEAGLRQAEACPNGCLAGVGCNAQAPVGFACASSSCVAGAVCQNDTTGSRRCCVRDCAAEGKECAPDGSCVCPAGQVGSGNGCSLQRGDPCGSGNAQCGAGLSCVDGVCCNEACSGTCESCNAPGSIGTCTFVANDTSGCGAGESCVARNDCRAGNSQSCAQPNDCVSNNCEPLLGLNGQSVCCAANCTAPRASCTSDGARCVQCQGNADCPNGCNVAQGLCNPPRALGEACNVAQQCGSGVCLPDVANAQVNRCCPNCAPGQLCSAQGACQNPPLGAGGRCQSDAQCSSGLLCRDGVCCTSACDGPCESCGGNGVCNAAVASDPQRCGPVTCTQTSNACRTVAPPAAGQCSGLGQCAGSAQCNVQLRPQGTVCNTTGQCDGAGNCVVPVLSANGQTCTASSQCMSNQCTLHFSDSDDDEFAAVGAQQTSFCVDASFDVFQFTTRQPVSLATTDCQEGNASVFPGQTRSFTTPAVGKASLPFDYNCDGQELSTNALLNRLQNCADTAVAVCESRGGYLPASSGVSGAVGIPACGQSGTFLPCADIPAQGGCVGSAGGPALRTPCR